MFTHFQKCAKILVELDMRVINLASGSKGNSTFIDSGNMKVLLDVGLSLSNLEKRLELVNEKAEDIDAIVITHEHSDHIHCLVQFLKKYKAIAYIPAEIVDGFLKEIPEFVRGKIVEMKGYDFTIGDILVCPFKLPHDSIVCYGYSFVCGDKKISFATDLGFMPESVLDKIERSNLVYIESNHDKKMLLGCAKYPYITKQRILGEHGHLSNEQCSQAIVKLAMKGTKYFVLSHLSENTNTVELAYVANAKALENAGFVLEKNVFLRYSRQDRPGNNFYFS